MLTAIKSVFLKESWTQAKNPFLKVVSYKGIVILVCVSENKDVFIRIWKMFFFFFLNTVNSSVFRQFYAVEVN